MSHSDGKVEERERESSSSSRTSRQHACAPCDSDARLWKCNKSPRDFCCCSRRSLAVKESRRHARGGERRVTRRFDCFSAPGRTQGAGRQGERDLDGETCAATREPAWHAGSRWRRKERVRTSFPIREHVFVRQRTRSQDSCCCCRCARSLAIRS